MLRTSGPIAGGHRSGGAGSRPLGLAVERPLEHGARIPGLRTTSTLGALSAAEAAGLVDTEDAHKLRDAWILASRARSAMTLWTAKTSDVLPTDQQQLEGVARLLEYPPGSAAVFEDHYLRVTRLARQVFERRFYGTPNRPTPTV